jgi:hypothetical protein
MQSSRAGRIRASGSLVLRNRDLFARRKENGCECFSDLGDESLVRRGQLIADHAANGRAVPQQALAASHRWAFGGHSSLEQYVSLA